MRYVIYYEGRGYYVRGDSFEDGIYSSNILRAQRYPFKFSIEYAVLHYADGKTQNLLVVRTDNKLNIINSVPYAVLERRKKIQKIIKRINK